MTPPSLGTVCGFLLAVGIGFWRGEGPLRRSALLAAYEVFLARLTTELLYAPATGELLASLAADPACASLTFLPRCLEYWNNLPLHAAWEKALAETSLPLTVQERGWFALPGRVLGQCPAEEQRQTFSRLRQTVAQAADAARQSALGKAKLFRMLGVLGGFAWLIVWW